MHATICVPMPECTIIRANHYKVQSLVPFTNYAMPDSMGFKTYHYNMTYLSLQHNNLNIMAR